MLSKYYMFTMHTNLRLYLQTVSTVFYIIGIKNKSKKVYYVLENVIRYSS